ncbi:MAG: hypothetical protein IT445_06090 [Phycisphaeraceae bacterium]|nr:hypothetical protein [Phycisphaeraceae bacterium]
MMLVEALPAGGSRIIERYEYTPYGERQVYTHGFLLADGNRDWVVNLADNQILGDQWGYTGPNLSADYNGDGSVGFGDLAILGDEYSFSVAYDNDPLVMYPSSGGSYRVTGSCVPMNAVGHQGLFHDEESGLVYNRARMLHPRLGRFMQRDPLGYVDGMATYTYRLNNPNQHVDPFGCAAIDVQRVRSALMSAFAVHRGFIYVDVFRLSVFFGRELAALQGLSPSNVYTGRGNGPEYRPLARELEFPTTTPNPSNVIHELVHVMNGAFVNPGRDEGQAYAKQRVVPSLGGFRAVENQLDSILSAGKAESQDIADLQLFWTNAWLNINKVIGSDAPVHGPWPNGKVGSNDISTHGLNVWCGGLKDKYNNHDGAKVGCLEFRCDNLQRKPTIYGRISIITLEFRLDPLLR